MSLDSKAKDDSLREAVSDGRVGKKAGREIIQTRLT